MKVSNSWRNDAQATHGLFAAISKITARTDPLQLPSPDDGQLRALRDALGRDLSPKDNDGIVPALSQVWGEVICAVRADHLDAIGHFGGDSTLHDPPHYDWFASGTRFTRDAFETLWRQVAAFIAKRAHLDRGPKLEEELGDRSIG